MGDHYPDEFCALSASDHHPPGHPESPCHGTAIPLAGCGSIGIEKTGRVFADRHAGVTEINNVIQNVSFVECVRVSFGSELDRDKPVSECPFTPAVLPMSPV